MTRIANAFDSKRGKTFIGFLTVGDPSLEKTEELVLEMAAKGVDLIELGIPFSDPIAEGAVIQAANTRALAAGTTLEKIFKLVQRLRTKTEVPLVFLTYLNPVIKYGYDDFFKKCKETGIDGIVIPDLPFEEKNEVHEFTAKWGIDLISLITPTSEERIKKIAPESEGFLYLVSSLGVTGVRSEIKTDIESIVNLAKSCSKVPIAVGFGIHTPEQANKFSKIADGVIIGSAIVKLIEQHGENSVAPVGDYVRKIKAAI